MMNNIDRSIHSPAAYQGLQGDTPKKYLNQYFTAAYSINHGNVRNNDRLTGRDLYYLAQSLQSEKVTHCNPMSDIGGLPAKPKNLAERFICALMVLSPWQREGLTQATLPTGDNNLAAIYAGRTPKMSRDLVIEPQASRYASSSGNRRHDHAMTRRQGSSLKVKREAAPSPRFTRSDPQYMLGIYLNKKAAAKVDPENVDVKQLGAKLIESVDRLPDIIPDIARLTLYGSHLYGERRGENLTPLQQRSLIAQALCRFIYGEESIVLRVVKLFDAQRHITHQEFAGIVQSWPYPAGYETHQRLWRENYEASEVPIFYLNSLYAQSGAQEAGNNDTRTNVDLDNLWVGSLTWTLLQFGARAITQEDPDKLKSMSYYSLIELGLGLVGMYRQGLLASGVEPIMYLGLLLYFLRARPDLGLGEILASDTVDAAFDALKAELEARHLTVSNLYNGFTHYQAAYHRPAWRSREAAAAELIKQSCGSADARLGTLSLPKGHAKRSAQTSVQQLLLSPSGFYCLDNGERVPSLDTFYQQQVDAFAGTIRDLDNALLSVAFMPSDVRDETLQADDLRFLQRSEIKWVIPKLELIRRPQDMFYSSVVFQHLGKPDALFFQAKQGDTERLFTLQTTSQGYLLRELKLGHHDYSALKPFMVDWPAPAMISQFKLAISSMLNAGLMKRSNETVALFLQHFAERHYQSYRLQIHTRGSTGGESVPTKVLDTVAGYVIPFYSCINSIIDNQHQAAFAECLVDGALVGLPLFFTGVKAGLGLFREGMVGAGQTLGGPMFSASNQEIFRNVVPTSVQIAGGIAGTSSSMRHFADVMGKQALNSLDPGFAALRSLGIVSKGLYLAVLGKTMVGLGALQPRLIKVSGELPKIVTESLDLEGTILYGAYGNTPLTLTIKGTDYSVLQIQNSSMVAVETGERMPDGHLMFAQLDIHSRFGIYKKYFCLYSGDNPRCLLTDYRHPAVRLDENVYAPSSQSNPYYWSLSSNLPIQVLVVYPLHMLEFGDRQWSAFEVNHRRWVLDHQTGNTEPLDNSDDWLAKTNVKGERVSMIEPGIDDRSFRLKLSPLRHRRKRDLTLPRVQDWRRLLHNYTLNDDGILSYYANIHNEKDLSVKIGEADYYLSIEKNACTFLLRHPSEPAAPMFRVAYVIDGGDFVFASPVELSNSHHIGESLRKKIEDNPQATQEPHIDFLLPPLFNGAFCYGNKMFLKIGDRILHIAHFNGIYHTLSLKGDKPDDKYWTLRYELFTGSFDIVDIQDHLPEKNNGIREPRSRFDRLALRTYSNQIYPTLATLCGMDYSDVDTLPLPESDLYTRLRQVALLLRLDEQRRYELLHATSVALRAFSMDRHLKVEWKNDFQALSLWTTLEKVVWLCRSHKPLGSAWSHRQWRQDESRVWRLPAPLLIARRPDMQLFISDKEYIDGHKWQKKDYALLLEREGVTVKPLDPEGSLRRWLPALEHASQRTIVTKFALSKTQQPIFWIDLEGQIWAQTPDGVKTPLYRHNTDQEIDEIVTSPDGSIVVLIHIRTSHTEAALFYSMPSMGSPLASQDLFPYKEASLDGSCVPGKEWWVTDTGDLFAPWDDGWSFLGEDNPHRGTPEGYQPDFVSPDQRFLGYTRRDDSTLTHEVVLDDTFGDRQIKLQRSRPCSTESFGMGRLASVAFSSLNALVALGFSDGYIEIFRIHDEENQGAVVSLGHISLPLAELLISDTRHPKPKQMAMKFNNAFDRLVVFHDMGLFSVDEKGNGSYVASEIYVADLQEAGTGP
ncbi:hypothetical protein EZJ58_5100 [Sodalis ligni]|uniref:Uncharacterized protein n=2 Tax=Sodalis ligni TaxID=2697027 RepID=A0A4R1NI99_9GAMM|nr:hypothetical protein EZJ58_5100 [Sodalis ligni]